MRLPHTIVRFYRTDESDFERALRQLLQTYCSQHIPVRFLFFGDADDDADYEVRLAQIHNTVKRFFSQPPLVSFVTQPPLEKGALSLEVHEIEPEEGGSVIWRDVDGFRYVVAEGGSGRTLFIGGARGDTGESRMQKQAETAFAKIGTVMDREGFPVSSIVRQWNYLERITEFDGSQQRYQGFNDARSRFYEEAVWAHGYPAATGIGTRRGGVVIDLLAFLPAPESRIEPVDNRLQIAAHDYSQAVLPGDLVDTRFPQKSTPKFERAKLVKTPSGVTLYISGTAAIRGEQSLSGMDAARQAEVTLENIAFLLNPERQRERGISPETLLRPLAWRVYVKRPADLDAIRTVMETHAPGIPVLYLASDVCREELLVEIEGVACGSGSVE